ncbi:holo-ACP synthase [Fictibacillus sp. KIGAM418]|uniref:Holo-[acyl-carrier-protein] synthase n=1 Tax=Fictibacillus marinisediminis TaxID=2878389 RepID=A0A9X1X769_9BACL|nr:holo-ACP synthase [Fictibacillus marinisediminis]MCK6255287.1 holo-ACP synthase [Fictibacillus marinisediminis]
MIIGTGIDIVEIARIEEVCQKQVRFPDRILTEKELEAYGVLKGRRQAEFLAGRFAAKEAYAKAVGTGIGKHLSWQDIEITKNDNGKPVIFGGTDKIAHLSISHSKEFAVAQVVLEAAPE